MDWLCRSCSLHTACAGATTSNPRRMALVNQLIIDECAGPKRKLGEMRIPQRARRRSFVSSLHHLTSCAS